MSLRERAYLRGLERLGLGDSEESEEEEEDEGYDNVNEGDAVGKDGRDNGKNSSGHLGPFRPRCATAKAESSICTSSQARGQPVQHIYANSERRHI